MTTCRYCHRTIVLEDGTWVDPEATGDDAIWRETCDSHDTFTAEHEPEVRIDPAKREAMRRGGEAFNAKLVKPSEGEGTMNDILVAKYEGRTYRIPGIWLAGFMSSHPGITVLDVLRWWHEQQQA